MSSKFLDAYVVLKTIGIGRYSKVKAVQCLETCSLYAAKIFTNEVLGPMAVHEANIMQSLRGQGIVRIIQTNLNGLYQKSDGTSKRCVYILMELCNNGDLFDLTRGRSKLSLYLIKTIFHQILSAVSSCHSQNVFHRDLRPENILFDSNFEVKLTDFGSAFIGGHQPTERLFPSKFTAPESYKGQYQGDLADIFSLGAILFYLIASEPPFHSVDPTDSLYKSFIENPEIFWKNHSQSQRTNSNLFTPEFKNLIHNMMNPNPHLRPSISVIKQHTWFGEENFDLEELKAEIFQRRKEAVEEMKTRKEIKAARTALIRNHRSEDEFDSGSLSFNEVNCKKFGIECFLHKFTQVRSWLDKKTLVNEVQCFVEKKNGFNIEKNEFSQVKTNIVTDLESLDLKIAVYDMDEYNLVSFKLLKGNNVELVKLIAEFVEGLERFNN